MADPPQDVSMTIRCRLDTRVSAFALRCNVCEGTADCPLWRLIGIKSTLLQRSAFFARFCKLSSQRGFWSPKHERQQSPQSSQHTGLENIGLGWRVFRVCRSYCRSGFTARLNHDLQSLLLSNREYPFVPFDLGLWSHGLVRIVGQLHRRPPVGRHRLANQ